jgi:hypothetical protein
MPQHAAAEGRTVSSLAPEGGERAQRARGPGQGEGKQNGVPKDPVHRAR